MEKLSLDDNELSEDIPAELGKLSKLTLLWLSENNLSGKIPVDLGGLSNLKLLISKVIDPVIYTVIDPPWGMVI